MNHQFWIVWDDHRLETVVDVTAEEQRRTWEKLRGELASESPVPSLGQLLLRAQYNSYNSQRHYEIYAVEVEQDITVQDIRDTFDSNYDSAKQMVREYGHCLYNSHKTQTVKE